MKTTRARGTGGFILPLSNHSLMLTSGPGAITTPALHRDLLDAPPRCPSAGFRVLLVEDDPRDARLTEIGLSDPHDLVKELHHAGSLADGITRAREALPDVALLDLGLPDSQGLETLRSFVAQVPEVPVVVLTHLADDEIAGQALDEGAQDYLIKGRLQGELLQRILRFAVERHGLIALLADKKG